MAQTGAEPRGARLTGRRPSPERAAAASGGRQRERIRRSHEYCGTWTQAACVPGGALPGAASFPSVRRGFARGKILSSDRGLSCPGRQALRWHGGGHGVGFGSRRAQAFVSQEKGAARRERGHQSFMLSPGALRAPLRWGGEREVRRAGRAESAHGVREQRVSGEFRPLLLSHFSALPSFLSLGDDIPCTELRFEAHQGRESFSGLEALPLILTESARFHFSVTLLLLLSPFSAPASGERIPGDGGRVSLSPGRGEEVCGGEFPISGPSAPGFGKLSPPSCASPDSGAT